MGLNILVVSLAAGLFVGMLICVEIGRRVGIARLKLDPDGMPKGIGAAEGAVFALVGLLVAFSFSGAASRFEERRHLITNEANAIGTAYLRVDLLPAELQPEIRALFRRYVDNRVQTYANVTDMASVEAKLAEGAALQGEIWNRVLAAGRNPAAPSQALMLMVPALNEMIDITTTRVMATRNHPPIAIFLLLAGLSLVGALLVGHAMADDKKPSRMHTFIFAAVLSLTVYVIIDLEFPRLGLIQVDGADRILLELRKSMN